MALLDVKNLTVDFNTDQGLVHAVRDISFTVGESEAVGIVGESGSGKSVTMYSVMGLLASNGEIKEGSVVFDGKEITEKSYPNHKAYEDQMSRIRGNEMAMIFQDPMTFLNPVVKIGKQITEVIKNHNRVNDREAKDRAVTLMGQVGIPSPGERFNQYPHEFSGGMRQRIIIAMALANSPKLIIADEPTTALDVTVQAQVLELLRDLQKKLNTAILLITHNLGVVWDMCDTVMVMYAGNTVEYADTKTLYQEPLHPYTWGLLDSMPKLSSTSKEELTTIPGVPPDLRLTGRCCNFYNRCPYVTDKCKETVPPLVEVTPGHFVACHRQNGEEHLVRGEVNSHGE